MMVGQRNVSSTAIWLAKRIFQIDKIIGPLLLHASLQCLRRIPIESNRPAPHSLADKLLVI